MPSDIPDILARIVAEKRPEVAEKLKLRKGLESMAETQRGQRRSFRQALVGGHFKLGTVPANPSPDANAWPFPTADSSLFYTSADFSRPSLPGPPLPIPGPRRQVPQDQQLAASAETPALRLA